MKKIFTAIALMFVVAAAMAQGFATPNVQFAGNESISAARQNAETTQLQVVDASGKKVVKRMLKAETTLPTADDIIKTQPEGTLYKNMYRNANVYIAYGSAATNRTYDGYVGDIVVSADGKKLYMKNPFLKFAPGTWLVGDLDESGNVEFKFPQAIYNQTGENAFTGYAWKMLVSSNSIAPDETTQSVKFKWDGKKLTQVNADELIGLTNENGEWMGYGAMDNTFSVQTDVVNKPADMSKAQDYRMSYYEYSGSSATASVKIVVDGKNMYLGGFMNPDFWIKGTISGSKVTFPSGQYLGVNSGNTHAYMLAYDLNTYQTTDNLTFSYDASEGLLSSEGTIEVNIGKNNMSSLGMFIYPYLEKMDYAVEAPAFPVVTGVVAYGSDPNEPEMAAVVYKLSNESASGKQLNEANIYYNIYLDGELQTFSTSEYKYLKADMTDIPYAFADSYTDMFSGNKGWDFKVNNEQQYVYFYKPFTKVAIQALYVDGDKTYKSSLVTYDVTGVCNDLTADKVEKGVSYTDISGRKVAAPAKGIYLKTVTYSDGTTKTVKVLK